MNKQPVKVNVSALITALLVMALFFGMGLMLYPSFSEWYNRANASTTINDYNRVVAAQVESEKNRLLEQAREYNRILAENTIRGGGTIDITNTEGEKDAYTDVLHLDEEGIMGYIVIPKISVRLPIYHGTNDRELQMGIGHLEGSSFPVPGVKDAANCVLVGHNGLPTARLFTDLDQMEIGDQFQLMIMNETITYEVAEINIVLPTDVDSLRIEEGRDLCTLLTCTPYGINSHRLLVIGKRLTPAETTADNGTDGTGTSDGTASVEGADGTTGKGTGAASAGGEENGRKGFDFDQLRQLLQNLRQKLEPLRQALYPYRGLFLAIAIDIAAIITALKIIDYREKKKKQKSEEGGENENK